MDAIKRMEVLGLFLTRVCVTRQAHSILVILVNMLFLCTIPAEAHGPDMRKTSEEVCPMSSEEASWDSTQAPLNWKEMYVCADFQRNWQVCTNEKDGNHATIMEVCPMTCKLARGECEAKSSHLGVSGQASLRRSQMHMHNFTLKDGLHFPGLTNIHYDDGYVKKCMSGWQANCIKECARCDEETKKLLCDSFPHRHHIMSRLLVPRRLINSVYQSGPELEWRNAHIHAGRQLPHFTSSGTKKIRAPKRLHSKVVSWFRAERHRARPEESPASGLWCNNDYNNDDFVLAIWNFGIFEDIKEIRDWLRIELEEWAQVDLNPNAVIYGVRMYHAGSVCAMHTDEPRDHIISAIYHVDSRGVDEPWSLTVVDHQGQYVDVQSEPGDMIFYESASIPHGRREPFKGVEMANMYFHFAPKNWEHMKDEAMKKKKPYTAALSQQELQKSWKQAQQELGPAIAERRASDACLPTIDDRHAGPEPLAAIKSPVMFVPIDAAAGTGGPVTFVPIDGVVCTWTEHPGKYLGDPRRPTDSEMPLAQAKGICLNDEGCKGVSCLPCEGDCESVKRCTPREGNPFLAISPANEVSYVKNCHHPTGVTGPSSSFLGVLLVGGCLSLFLLAFRPAMCRHLWSGCFRRQKLPSMVA